jgi:hypothetical protein
VPTLKLRMGLAKSHPRYKKNTYLQLGSECTRCTLLAMLLRYPKEMRSSAHSEAPAL